MSMIGLRMGLCRVRPYSKSKSLLSHKPFRIVLGVGSATAFLLLGIPSASCTPPPKESEIPVATAIPIDEKVPLVPDDSSGEGDEGPDVVEKLIEQLGPIAMRFGFGGGIGFCVGKVTKTAGIIAAYAAGIAFVGLQGAAYYGIIELDWFVVQSKAVELLDQNGDGKFDTEDMKLMWRKFKSFATNALPSSSGFSAGFLLGLRY
jgi:uncharacterized membrane protein (Fun14 family)